MNFYSVTQYAKNWFFGHYHDNRNVNAEEILLYEQIIRISWMGGNNINANWGQVAILCLLRYYSRCNRERF